MKQRTEKNGTKENNWTTLQYIYDYIEKEFFNGYSEYFDPCPLNSDFNGLKIDWGLANYINPPYTQKLKEAFIIKALEESKKGKLCVLLIPASTETKIFHEIIIPHAKVILIKKRVMFKGYNTKGEYVTNKTGQSGSMFIIFGKDHKPEIKTVNLGKTKEGCKQ